MFNLVNISVIVIGILSMITNGVLLVILIKDPLNFFKSTTTYFIISLAVADMVTGANACMWGIYYLYPEELDYYQGYLLSLFWITTQASFLTLLAMSVERFFVVRYPFDSRTWITKKRVCWSIALIWLVPVILGGLILLPSPEILYVQFSIFTEFFVSVFVIAGLYANILLRVRNSKKAFAGSSHKGGKSYGMSTIKNNFQVSAALMANIGDSNSGGVIPSEISTHNENSIPSDSSTHNGNSVPSDNSTHDRNPVPSENSTHGRNPVSSENSTHNGSPVPAENSTHNGNPVPSENSTHNGNWLPTGDENSPPRLPSVGTQLQNGGTKVGGDARNGNKTRLEKYRAVLSISGGKERNVSSEMTSDDSKTSKTRLTRQVSRNNQQENKLTAVVLLLVGVLLVTILPYLLVSQIYVGYILFCQCEQLPGLKMFMYIYFPIELLNFCVNPLIYAWRLPQYRRTLRYLFSRHQAAGNFRGSSAFVRGGTFKQTGLSRTGRD